MATTLDTSIQDAGLFTKPYHFREFRDIPSEVIEQAVQNALRPNPNAVKGCARPSLARLDSDGLVCYKALKNILPSNLPISAAAQAAAQKAPLPQSSFSAQSSFPSQSFPGQPMTGRGDPNQSYSRPSPYSTSPSPYSSSPYSSSPYSSSPYSTSASNPSPQYGNGGTEWRPQSGGIGGGWGGRDQIQRQDRYIVLSRAQISSALQDQLMHNRVPIEMGALFAHLDDGTRMLQRDYCQTYGPMLNQAPSDYTRIYGNPGYSPAYGGGGMDSDETSMAAMMHMHKYQNDRQNIILEIQRLDKSNGVVTDPAVEKLNLLQLMELLARKQKQTKTDLNTSLYDKGILAVASFASRGANGHTGNRILDRYCNLSSFADNLRESRADPWWNYTISELAKESSAADSPLLSLAAMIGLAGCKAINDGIDASDREEAKKKAIEEARVKHLEEELRAIRMEQAKKAPSKPTLSAKGPGSGSGGGEAKGSEAEEMETEAETEEKDPSANIRDKLSRYAPL